MVEAYEALRNIIRLVLLYGGLLLALSSLGALTKMIVAGGAAGSPPPGGYQPSWHLWGSYAMYLDKGDVAVIHVRAPVNVSWRLSVGFVRVCDGRSWNYSSQVSAGEPPPIEFVAPRRGVYVVEIKATSGDRELPLYTSVGVRDSGKYGARNTLALIAALGILLSVLGALLGGGEAPGILMSLGWEIRGMMRHTTMMAMVFVLSYAYTSFNPMVEWLETVFRRAIWGVPTPRAFLLFVEKTCVNPPYDLFTVIYMYLVITAASLFSYEDERGLTRDALAVGRGRVELYMAKLGALAVLAFTPLILTHVLLVSLSDPCLLAAHKGLAAWLYARRLLWDAWLVLACAAPALAFSVIFRKTLYAVLAASLTPYLLEMLSDAPWLRLRTAFYTSEFRLTTDPIYGDLWFFAALAAASMILGLLSWIYRDNP